MPERIRAPRAQMFQSFDALEGFRDIIRAQEKIVVEKRELTDDDCDQLNQTIMQIEKGMMVKVVFYEDGQFVQVEGKVAKINFDTKILQIVKKKIKMNTIFELERL